MNSFGQKTVIESLINQIASQEVPKNFKYYCLVEKSLPQPEQFDSLRLGQKNKLLRQDLNFPMELITLNKKEYVDWRKYDLENVKYTGNDLQRDLSPRSKQVYFIKNNIEESKYDSLIENRKPNTIYVKKRWVWNKKRVEKEINKAWEKHDKENIEESVYFNFSKPIFSTDLKYARISISKNKKYRGFEYTAIYKYENGNWKKLIEYNEVAKMTY